MYYRRNADSRLRSLERTLTISYTLDNLLAYNQELLRHGMPTVVAPPEFVRKALERLWLGRFSVWGIGDLQFPALEIKKNILDEAYPLLRPGTLQQFNPFRQKSSTFRWRMNAGECPKLSKFSKIAILNGCRLGISDINFALRNRRSERYPSI